MSRSSLSSFFIDSMRDTGVPTFVIISSDKPWTLSSMDGLINSLLEVMTESIVFKYVASLFAFLPGYSEILVSSSRFRGSSIGVGLTITVGILLCIMFCVGILPSPLSFAMRVLVSGGVGNSLGSVSQ